MSLASYVPKTFATLYPWTLTVAKLVIALQVLYMEYYTFFLHVFWYTNQGEEFLLWKQVSDILHLQYFILSHKPFIPAGAAHKTDM